LEKVIHLNTQEKRSSYLFYNWNLINSG
jgi:hypothetical protein